MNKSQSAINRRRRAGQSLVIFALSLVAMLGMAALVLDGGNAFAQQRVTQNGADAAANAGAVVLAQNLIATGAGVTPSKSDTDVLNAVNTAAANNSIATAPTAYYTDISGNRLSGPIVVGTRGGQLPPSTAYGVEVDGSRTFNTFIGNVFGLLPGGTAISQLTASARATAIAGQVKGICPGDAPCGFLPVTFPINLTLCDGSNKQINFGQALPYTYGNVGDPNSEVILPLCQTGPGSVGWLDITPHDPSCNGNGSAFLACEITKPGNTGLQTPIWIHTVPGNTNSVLVQNAMNTYIGKTVEIPFYECMSDNVGQVGPAPYCPGSTIYPGTPVAPPGSNGNNAYYRIVAVGNFVLDHAYIQGNNPECNQAPGKPLAGGNGATGCLKGWFVEALNFGTTIGLPSNSLPWSAYGTQLVR